MDQYVEKINRAAAKFLSALTLDETFQHIIEEACDLTSAVSGSIYLGDKDDFKRVYTTNITLSTIKPRQTDFVYNAFMSNSPQIIKRAEVAIAYPEFIEIGLDSLVTVPLSHQSVTSGVMILQFKQPVNSLPIEPLKELSTLAALAIRKTNYGSEKNKLQQDGSYISMDHILQEMYSSAVKFFASQSLEETYRTIVEEVIKLVGAAYGSILLEYKGSLKRVYATSPVILRIRARKRGDTYTVFRSQEVAVFNMKKVRKVHPDFKELNIQSIVAIPLTYLNKSIGVLTMHFTHTSEIDSATLRVLKLFGALASMAIKKNQLLSETKSALETRDLFISMAAHELRTPLTTIHGYTQLLQRKLANDPSTPELSWSQQIYRQSTRLNVLINELLEVNRIRSGAIQYVWNECDMREVINRAITNVEFSHNDREIIFENHFKTTPPIVVGDFDRLLQVIINLLDNALKFSNSTEPVYITLKKQDKNVVVTVKDKGQGIEPTDIPRILKGFYKTAESSHREGLGLGLFLSSHTIERHHGSFDIKSQKNKGTTVTIKLPRI